MLRSQIILRCDGFAFLLNACIEMNLGAWDLIALASSTVGILTAIL